MSDRDEGRRYGLHSTDVTDATELEATRQLLARLATIDDLVTRWNRVANVNIRATSEMGLDDRHSAWRHLSHTLHHAMNTAVDNLASFKRLVLPSPEGPLTLPYSAHFPILRAAIESSSEAFWLLAPDDPRERISRLLRVSAGELADDAALNKQLFRDVAIGGEFAGALVDKGRKQAKARYDKHARQLRKVARDLGLEDFTGHRHVVGYAEIVREATAATGMPGYYGEVIWRITSGLTHPSLMRALAHSQLEEIGDNGDGTLNGVLTTDVSLTRTALEAAALTTRSAIEMYGQRKIRPGDPSSYLAPKK